MDRSQSTSALLDDDQLTDLVGYFYARVRRDPLLGPVFADHVDDWDRHLHRLVAFWSSVVNGSGRYRGNPVRTHAAIAGAITPPMFDRWLSLWEETSAQVLPTDLAALVQTRAMRMADALRKAVEREGTMAGAER